MLPPLFVNILACNEEKVNIFYFNRKATCARLKRSKKQHIGRKNVNKRGAKRLVGKEGRIALKVFWRRKREKVDGQIAEKKKVCICYDYLAERGGKE